MTDISRTPWSGDPTNWPDTPSFCDDCLINLNEGEDRSTWVQSKCKLPYKHGSTVNANGVHAAAASLAGARNALRGVAPNAKRQAGRKLVKLYNEMNEPVPHSLKSIAH